MNELKVLEDMIDSTYQTEEFKFNLNEFKNQLLEVAKVIESKDKEIKLKERHINELEDKCKNLESFNKDNIFKANMYKSMLEAIFNKI